jgi:hypothetical protein
METAKIAVDSCYVLRQFLTPLPSIDFREIRGLLKMVAKANKMLGILKRSPEESNFVGTNEETWLNLFL